MYCAFIVDIVLGESRLCYLHSFPDKMCESDLAIARILQDQFDQEANSEIVSFLPEEYRYICLAVVF